MLRAIWFAVQLGLLFALAVWLAERPGAVDVHWLGYDIHAQIGFVLVTGLILLLLLLWLHRLFLGLLGLSSYFKRRRLEKKRGKGVRALTLGLSALAAGDSRIAAYQVARMRALLPEDHGLSLLLEAQAARLKGDHQTARDLFEQLVAGNDTGFLGLRGLMLEALDTGEPQQALSYARQALKLHPRQPWVTQAVYRLEIRSGHWQAAEKALTAVEKSGALTPVQVKAEQEALLLQQAEDLTHQNQPKKALKLLKQAHRLAPDFIPASLALAAQLIELGHKNAARKVTETAWTAQPHPEFVPLWDRLSPPEKKKKGEAGEGIARLHWFEKLVALKPDSGEGQMAAGIVAMEDRLWGEARKYFEAAGRLAPTALLYRLWAEMEEQAGNYEAARALLAKAADAPADKVWYCKETGRIYDRWSAIAMPHGAFNTIEWGYPQDRSAPDKAIILPKAPDVLMVEQELL